MLIMSPVSIDKIYKSIVKNSKRQSNKDKFIKTTLKGYSNMISITAAHKKTNQI